MKRGLLTWLCALGVLPWMGQGQALQVQFGPQGLQSLTYNGEVLEDTARWPDDQFHIWHMKCFDASGNVRTDGEYGWGENNEARSWDAASHSWTYTFVWGSIRVQYLPRANELDMVVTETNRADSGVTLDGASIYPATLHPPSDVAGIRVVDGLQEPVTVAATWSDARAIVVAPRPAREIYGGFETAGNGGIAMIASGTRPDSVPAGEGGSGRSVKPGQTDSFVVSLRFAPLSASIAGVAADAYKEWSALHPAKLSWPDRRIIGTKRGGLASSTMRMVAACIAEAKPASFARCSSV